MNSIFQVSYPLNYKIFCFCFFFFFVHPLLLTDSNPSLKALIPALRPNNQPQGPNPSLKAQIPASRPKSQPQGPNPSQDTPIPA